MSRPVISWDPHGSTCGRGERRGELQALGALPFWGRTPWPGPSTQPPIAHDVSLKVRGPGQDQGLGG